MTTLSKDHAGLWVCLPWASRLGLKPKQGFTIHWGFLTIREMGMAFHFQDALEKPPVHFHDWTKGEMGLRGIAGVG